jgi:hypothetical protein
VKSNKLQKFLAEYEQAFGMLDFETIANLYADRFISADPNGATCINNDEQFQKGLSQVQEFYKSMGIVSSRIVSSTETAISDHYSMVTIPFCNGTIIEKESGVACFGPISIITTSTYPNKEGFL